jgi:hypothetical protein
MMDVQFTAVFRRVPERFIAFVEELPGADTRAPKRADLMRRIDAIPS